MHRIRTIFSKTGSAAFISHVDLPVIFARAARRAGLKSMMTEGFTPRARLALGPPLPVGVVGMAEPADFWFEEWNNELAAGWSQAMPPGLTPLCFREVEGASLSKLCSAASYRVELLNGGDVEAACRAVSSYLSGEAALHSANCDSEAVSIVSGELERCGPSRMVAAVVAAGVVKGWKDLLITRVAVGSWDEEAGRLHPVMEERRP